MLRLVELLIQLLALSRDDSKVLAEEIRRIAKEESLKLWRRERARVRRRSRELHDDDDDDDEEE